MDKKRVIGLDLGTTSAKAVTFQMDGKVVSEAEVKYPIITAAPGYAEQDPNAVEEAAAAALKKAMEPDGISGSTVCAAGISAAMHSWLPLDSAGEPLMNAMIWADGRSSSIAEAWHDSGKAEGMYMETGTPVHPMSPLMKTLWVKENMPETFKKAERWVSLKEFLISRWFGEYVVDYAIASATGLFDFKNLIWSRAALESCGLSESQLSRPVQPVYLLKGLSANITGKTGLSADVPFVVGGSDGPLANLGMGATGPGDMAVTIGTSGAVRQMSAGADTGRDQEVFCYAFTKNLRITGGPTNNGGIALQWIKDLVSDRDLFGAVNPLERHVAESAGAEACGSLNDQLVYDHLIKAASDVAPGAEGLIFQPWLNGERAPIWEAAAKGSFTGLSMRHSYRHMVRAVLEGVLFNVVQIKEAVERTTGPAQSVYTGGGFARSDVWVQMLADITGQTVHRPLTYQSSAWGAAWMALFALGEVEELEDIKNHIPMGQKVQPDPDVHKRYVTCYEAYKRLSRHQK